MAERGETTIQGLILGIVLGLVMMGGLTLHYAVQATRQLHKTVSCVLPEAATTTTTLKK